MLESAVLSLIFLTVSICLFFFYDRRLYFEKYPVELSSTEFKKAIKVTADELDWRILNLTENYAKIYRPSEPLDGATERIIIKKRGNFILINSLASPDSYANRNSRKRNKENVTAFLKNTAGILKGENVEALIKARKTAEEEAFWNSNE